MAPHDVSQDHLQTGESGNFGKKNGGLLPRLVVLLLTGPGRREKIMIEHNQSLSTTVEFVPQVELRNEG